MLLKLNKLFDLFDGAKNKFSEPASSWKHEQLTMNTHHPAMWQKHQYASLHALVKDSNIEAVVALDANCFILQTPITEPWYMVKTNPEFVLPLPKLPAAAGSEVVSSICDDSCLYVLSALFFDASCVEFSIYAFHFTTWSWERLAAVPCQLPRMWCAREDLPLLAGRTRTCLWDLGFEGPGFGLGGPGSIEVFLQLKTEHASHYVVTICGGVCGHSKISKIEIPAGSEGTLLHVSPESFLFQIDGKSLSEFSRPRGYPLSSRPIKTPLPRDGSRSIQANPWCSGFWNLRVSSIPFLASTHASPGNPVPEIWLLHLGLEALTRWEYIGTAPNYCNTGIATSALQRGGQIINNQSSIDRSINTGLGQKGIPVGSLGVILVYQYGCFAPGLISRYRRQIHEEKGVPAVKEDSIVSTLV